MMKKRIALLGLLGCVALCSEKIQAAAAGKKEVIYDGYKYMVSPLVEATYMRHYLGKQSHADIVDYLLKQDPTPELVADLPMPSAPSAESVGMSPAKAQLDAGAAIRVAAAMPTTPVRAATAASASAAQPEEHEALSAGEKKALGLAGYGEPQIMGLNRTIRTEGRSAENVQEALRKAHIAMRAAGNEASTRKLLNSTDSPMRGCGFSNADLDEVYARQMQEEMNLECIDQDAALAAAMEASLNRPSRVVVEEVVVRPADKQYREVLVVKPAGMSDEIWDLMQQGMTLDEATEYMVVMAQAEVEEVANAAAVRMAQAELEAQAVADLVKAERIDLLIQKYQAYAATRRDLGLSIDQVVNMVATEVVLEAAERAALEAAFREATEAAGLRVLRARLIH